MQNKYEINMEYFSKLYYYAPITLKGGDNPNIFKNVIPEFQNVDMCLAAVISNPSLFRNVRPDLQTDEMSIISVLYDSSTIELVRPDLRDRVKYVTKMIKAGINLYPYDQSVHSDIHNVVVDMMKKEIKEKLTCGRKIHGLKKVPDYIIEYMIDYYIKDINAAAKAFIIDNKELTEPLNSDNKELTEPLNSDNKELTEPLNSDNKELTEPLNLFISEYCYVEPIDMIIILYNKEYYLYDFIKVV
jgi:hypothetical protein